MKTFIKKNKGVRGFIGTTYAVFNYENGQILKIFFTKKEAEEYAESLK